MAREFDRKLILEDGSEYYGYGFGGAAENLLQCSEGYSASDMVTLWMGSAGHRANILDPGLATVGIGVYRSGGMLYVATIFTD